MLFVTKYNKIIYDGIKRKIWIKRYTIGKFLSILTNPDGIIIKGLDLFASRVKNQFNWLSPPCEKLGWLSRPTQKLLSKKWKKHVSVCLTVLSLCCERYFHRIVVLPKNDDPISLSVFCVETKKYQITFWAHELLQNVDKLDFTYLRFWGREDVPEP